MPANRNHMGSTPPFMYKDLVAEIAAELLAEEEAAREKHWHIFAKRTEATEDKFKPKLIALFDAQEKSVVGKLKRKPAARNVVWVSPPNRVESETNSGSTHPIKIPTEEAETAAEAYVAGIFAPATWHVQFRDTARPFVTEAFREAGEAVFAEVGVEAIFNVTNPAAKKILQERVFKFAQEVNLTTQDRLRSQLAYAFDAGESIPQIEKRIANVFDIARGSRTNMIARTEIVGASNQGAFQGYKDSKIVETKIWIDSRDQLVREAHKIDGEERKLNERFSNGLMHPHDPGGAAELIINCRCTTAAGKLKAA